MKYNAADIDELTAWMKATGAEKILGMSAMEVMARYDSDGSGQLDQEEMDDIKAWVQREREAAEAAAAKENLAVSDMDYMEDRNAGAIDTKAVLALVQQVSVNVGCICTSCAVCRARQLLRSTSIRCKVPDTDMIVPRSILMCAPSHRLGGACRWQWRRRFSTSKTMS